MTTTAPRQGPRLTIAGTCAGCAHLSWSTCKAERADAVSDALGKPIPWPGETPAWCPLLPAARLALARSVVGDRPERSYQGPMPFVEDEDAPRSRRPSDEEEPTR
jgi:hypothetical protein